MQDPIRRVVNPPVRPAGPFRPANRREEGKREFSLEERDSSPVESEEAPEEPHQSAKSDPPVGPPPDDEAGHRIDVTA